MRDLKQWLMLGVFVLLAEGAGIVGSLFTAPAIKGWYAQLVRPDIAPPNWIFAPVWTMLFLLMGTAAFLVWQKGMARADVRVALRLFLFQLGLNVLWSAIFFGLRSPGGALIEIACLWFMIAATIAAFARVSNVAAFLLAPYLAWVTFAAYLNYLIWMLNA